MAWDDWDELEPDEDILDEDRQPREFGCCLPDCLNAGEHYPFECFNAEMMEAMYAEHESEQKGQP